MSSYRPHENPKASVAILCPYIFFAQAFKGILEYYPDAEIVPDFTTAPVGHLYPTEAKEHFYAWLQESGLPWRDVEKSGLSPKEFFNKYGTVVAPFYGGWTQNPVLKNHHKVRVFYGGAKDLWGFALWNAYFDAICTPGPYFTDILHKLYGIHGVRVVSTGEPKLDPLSFLTKESAQEELSLSGTKPVVLVASTWGSLSSLPKVAGALISLSAKYDIVVKAHHMTSIYEPEVLDMFKETSIKLIDQTVPITTALAASDVVISDSSGAVFDTLLAEKPLVLLDTVGIPNDNFYIENAFYGSVAGKLSGVPTYEKSLEQQFKKGEYHTGPIIDLVHRTISSRELDTELERAITQYSKNPSKKEFLASHFSPLDGNAARRVAEEITRVAQTSSIEQKSTEQTLLPLLINDFQERIKREARTSFAEKEENSSEIIAKLERIKKLPFLQRVQIVIDEFFS